MTYAVPRRSLLRTAALTVGAGSLATAAPTTASAAVSDSGAVLTGFDTLRRDGYAMVAGQRVGLISNPTGVVRDLRHEVDVMAADDRVDLVAAFGPEHGFRGSAQAGGSEPGGPDPRTGIPVYDTYTKTPAQVADYFRQAGVETVMFDIQDVGARFYTYIWTMYDCMVAASLAGVRFLVLDRPNPIGATAAYGPVMHPDYASFVGRKAISQQHGMTVGELAGLFNAEFLPDDSAAAGPVELAVSPMEGWQREMYAEQTGQPWVMPSPNMPRVETAVVYPGTCLFEATNLSEGRGTTRPFELIGAPYADHRWAAALDERELPGVDFREAYFTPITSKHTGKTCAGVQLHVADRDAFEAIPTAIAMMVTARDLYADFAWRETQAPVLDRPAHRFRPGAAGDRLGRRRRRGGGRVAQRARQVPQGAVPLPALPAGRVVRAAAAGVLALTLAGALAVGAVPVGSAAGGDDTISAEQKRVRVSETSSDVSPDDLQFPHHRLRTGSPAEARLLAEPLDRMSADLRSFLDPSPTHPMYAGGVVLASRNGVVPVHDAAGMAVRYADADTELPADQQVPMRRDTIFDLASVTKTFTTIAVMQQVEAGRVELDESVATYLPAFAAHGKDDVTVRDLLTHTGGLPAWLPLYSRYPTKEERLAAVLDVEPTAEPGQKYVYSDLGLITLGLLVEEVTDEKLDDVIADGITRPLGMSDTMFNPPARLVDRIAATEPEPWAGRPMIRGEVHDENAWSLGGVAGHAGLFSTAGDLAVLARTLLNGGRYGTARILETETVRAMLVNENTEFPANSHGLGFELDQRWYMDGLSTPVTFGHTGFTGTSVVMDPLSDSFVILLTNRVHPTRDWGSNNPSRRAMARDLARAIAVRPLEGDTAWFSGVGDARTVSLTTSSLAGRVLSFGLWYDTEAGYDKVTLEASTDGGSSWAPVPFTLRSRGDTVATDGSVSGFGGRVWHDATAALPVADSVLVRWRYASDAAIQGRGVYVDAVQVDGSPVDDGTLTAEGWHPSAD